MEKTFKALGTDEELISGLLKQNISVPTEIQTLVIPKFLEKKDIIAQAKTGSGKTLAYLLPLFMMVDTKLRSTQAIILTPTHELAAQVQREAELLAESSGCDVRSILIIGGTGVVRQLDKLKEKPQIVIGSAGRILDLIGRKKIQAHTVKTIVIDEADRMLDDLNIDGVKAVIKTTLKDRQLVLLSASMGDEARRAASTILKEDIAYCVSEEKLPSSIQHVYIMAEQRDKLPLIRKIAYSDASKKVIVFINNTENINVIVDKLCFHGLKAVGIYGGISTDARKTAMADFREGRAQVLVTSDISARGLDVDGVSHVINLDIPEEPVFYLHRAGRTGRQDAEGMAISIITPYEKKWINKYERAFGIKFTEMEMSFGKLVKAVPKNMEKKAENKGEAKPESIREPKKFDKRLKAEPKKVYKDKKKDNIKGKTADEPKGFFALKAEKKAEKEKNNKK